MHTHTHTHPYSRNVLTDEINDLCGSVCEGYRPSAITWRGAGGYLCRGARHLNAWKVGLQLKEAWSNNGVRMEFIWRWREEESIMDLFPVALLCPDWIIHPNIENQNCLNKHWKCLQIITTKKQNSPTQEGETSQPVYSSSWVSWRSQGGNLVVTDVEILCLRRQLVWSMTCLAVITFSLCDSSRKLNLGWRVRRLNTEPWFSGGNSFDNSWGFVLTSSHRKWPFHLSRCR